jgi:hypothetical protein
MERTNTKRITKKWLEDHSACTSGIEYWLTLDKKHRHDPVWLMNHAINSDNKVLLNYANWLIARVLSRKNALRYAVFAARQVLHLVKDQDASLKAIEAAEAVIKKDSAENREKARKAAADAARAVAYANYAAADAADAAADAARAVAYANYAAAAAADAADAVAYANYAAADAARAVADAARKEMNIKILKYGIKLLEGN